MACFGPQSTPKVACRVSYFLGSVNIGQLPARSATLAELLPFSRPVPDLAESLTPERNVLQPEEVVSLLGVEGQCHALAIEMTRGDRHEACCRRGGFRRSIKMAQEPSFNRVTIEATERALRRARREYDRERASEGATLQSVLSAQDRWWKAKLALDAAVEQG